MHPWAYGVLIISVATVIVWSTRIIVGHLSASRQAKAALTRGEEYYRLTEEYRRLTDMAITTQEHTDLKLRDLTVQMEYMREQLDSLQRILKEVE